METATGKVTGSFGAVQEKMTSVWSQIVAEEGEVNHVPNVGVSCFNMKVFRKLWVRKV
jgi:hypothetical protein